MRKKLIVHRVDDVRVPKSLAILRPKVITLFVM